MLEFTDNTNSDKTRPVSKMRPGTVFYCVGEYHMRVCKGGGVAASVKETAAIRLSDCTIITFGSESRGTVVDENPRMEAGPIKLGHFGADGIRR